MVSWETEPCFLSTLKVSIAQCTRVVTVSRGVVHFVLIRFPQIETRFIKILTEVHQVLLICDFLLVIIINVKINHCPVRRS